MAETFFSPQHNLVVTMFYCPSKLCETKELLLLLPESIQALTPCMD